MLEEAAIRCPYCGEAISLVVDASAGSQRYVEDCPVCCRPIAIELAVDGDTVRVHGATGDEA
jgi:hypothetical protein